MTDSSFQLHPPRTYPQRLSATAAAVVLAGVICLASPATRAQSGGDLPDATFRPTRGVYIPGGARAGDADATAVELNPGQLPLLGGGATALVADVWRARAAMPGRGAALMLASPLWKGGAIGMGLHGIGASDGALSSHSKFQLAYGMGGRTFGVGISWAHLFGGGVGGTDTFDAGVGWRPFNGVAAAFVIEDFGRPRLPETSQALPRRWVGELAIRPLGTDVLEVAVAALHLGLDDDRWSRLGTRWRLGARMGGPWRLLAEVERAPRRPGALPLGTDSGVDWRASAGIAVDFDHGSLAVVDRRSFTPDGVPGENWGGSVVLRTLHQRNSSSASPTRAVRLSVEGVDSDREFLTLALRLRQLARDSATSAVLLKVENVELGLGRIEELRDLIGELRARGKRVVAYVTSASTRELYLASACDKVVMHPAGGLTFAGVAQAVTFYKGAMDRLGVAVELVRIAEFKGAMEPYIMTGQSGPVRENRNQLLDDVYARILDGIATGRASSWAPPAVASALQAAHLKDLTNLGAFTPQEAQRVGLIDVVRDQHEAEQYVRELLGDRDLDIVDADKAPPRSPRWTPSRIAVVMVDGTITDGPSQALPLNLGGVAGGDTLVEALEECRRNREIRAVVLRVNSPGGSAFSSDVIARAVARVRAAGKPVVASMGDVAASGGYYIAAPTDTIFAEPSTTTGSIGIFAFKLDLSRLLEMLSLNVEVLRRGPHADQQAAYRPWTPEEREIAARKIRHLYEMFTATVAAGRQSRGLTPARVDEVGRGHVWTGSQARTRGLVDEMGGVVAAVDRAAVLGGIHMLYNEAPDLLVLPRANTSILQTLAGMSDEAFDSPPPLPPQQLPATLKPAARLVAPYLLGTGTGIEARLPFDLDVR